MKARGASQAAAAPLVLRAHGGGGSAMGDLLERFVFPRFPDPRLAERGDSAVWSEALAGGARLAMTTDAFVVSPLFFPGGDLGRLAVCGTVNDLAVAGARPVALSLALILEEGFPLVDLDRILASASAAAAEAGVAVVTGDTKVVERATESPLGGAGTGCYAVTAGIGVVPEGRDLSPKFIRPGDVLVLSGSIAEHGVAVLAAREGLDLGHEILSDAAPLAGLVEALLSAAPGTRFLRDATRGGVLAVFCEAARAAGLSFQIDEEAVPLRAPTRAALAMLGLDPLAVANEGVFFAAVPPGEADAALAALHKNPLGARAARVGEAWESEPGRVVLVTSAGGRRILVPPYGEELSRIC